MNLPLRRGLIYVVNLVQVHAGRLSRTRRPSTPTYAGGGSSAVLSTTSCGGACRGVAKGVSRVTMVYNSGQLDFGDYLPIRFFRCVTILVARDADGNHRCKSFIAMRKI